MLYDDHIGKVSLIGAGMRSHPGFTATFSEEHFAGVGVNIDLIATSEIRSRCCAATLNSLRLLSLASDEHSALVALKRPRCMRERDVRWSQ